MKSTAAMSPAHAYAYLRWLWDDESMIDETIERWKDLNPFDAIDAAAEKWDFTDPLDHWFLSPEETARRQAEIDKLRKDYDANNKKQPG